MQINWSADPGTQVPAGVSACLNYVNSTWASNFTIGGSFNIQVGWGTINGQPLNVVFAESQQVWQKYSWWNNVRVPFDAALGSEGMMGMASGIPTQMPDGTDTCYLSVPQAILFGLLSPAPSGVHGYIGFSSEDWWHYEKGVTPPPGQYDFWSVLTHELTEALGRAAGYSSGLGACTLLDLTRYASVGVRSNPAQYGGWFSNDSGGRIVGPQFNTSGSDDMGDWDNSNPGPDSFNNSIDPGLTYNLSTADWQLLSCIGIGNSIGNGVSS